MVTKAWSIFKKWRIIILALSATLCIALTVVYTLYLARGWTKLTNQLRGLVIGIIAIHVIGMILLYLMVVMPFKRWLDAGRVFVFGIAQFGVVVTFVVLQTNLPCNRQDLLSFCNTIVQSSIFGDWALTGLLLLYLFLLVAMIYAPQSATYDSEAALYNGRSDNESVESLESFTTPQQTTNYSSVATSAHPRRERSPDPISPFAPRGNPAPSRPPFPVMRSNGTGSGQTSGSQMNWEPRLMHQNPPTLSMPPYYSQRVESIPAQINPIWDNITLPGAQIYRNDASAGILFVGRSQYPLLSLEVNPPISGGLPAPGNDVRNLNPPITTPAALIPGMRNHLSSASAADGRRSTSTSGTCRSLEALSIAKITLDACNIGRGHCQPGRNLNF